MHYLRNIMRRWRKPAAQTGGARPDLPIAILSFDRPHYLRDVLRSLRPQVAAEQKVMLFQDGGYNAWSGRQKGDERRIDRCVELFLDCFPEGEVHRSPTNLGIALNYERAEQHVFRTMAAQAALFLEDDLWLSPNYLHVVGTLLDFADADPRIAYVSAYGDMFASLEEQRQAPSALRRMHENWGAALTRETWLAERPFREAYLRFIADIDYSDRDHAAISSFYAERGWDNRVTSQDGARWIAALERGAVRITTSACHARYLGQTGEHFTPRIYAASGFDRTMVWRGSPPTLSPPTDAMIADWLAAERARFRSGGGHDYARQNAAGGTG